MKYTLSILALVGLLCGCATTPAGKTTQAEGVVIPAVNTAMGAWSAYVASGKATQTQINAVEAAYNAYYTAQLGAEAALIETQVVGTTNDVDAATAQAAVTNAENSLIGLITQYTK